MSLVPQTMLMDPAYGGPDWHGDVVGGLAARLTPPSDFPCTFSQNAWRRGLVDLIFVEDLSPDSLAQLRADLSAYVAQSRAWDGQVNSGRPLVVAFSPKAARAGDLAGYHAIGWRVLQDWHDHDPAPWPEDVATAPEDPYWTMCFDGMQLFVNMSCPAHEQRQSRNLGEHLLFIVNPRTRFDIVAGDTPEGRRVRQVIRARCAAYDGQPHAPELGSFQAGEIEWRQYGLSDVNGEMASSCPFRQDLGR